jgi:hypothetical protein
MRRLAELMMADGGSRRHEYNDATENRLQEGIAPWTPH